MWSWWAALFNNPPPDEPKRPFFSNNPLSGKPLDYVIGTSRPPKGVFGRILEVAYDVNTLPAEGDAVGYCNLFDEDDSGIYGPYLRPDDVAEQYNEGRIDPDGAGWKKNLKEQFARRAKAGFQYIELDNPDSYHVDYVVGAVELAATYGLRVIAKNPHLVEPDPISYVRHANVYGIIVERNAGTPRDMEALRVRAGKPVLPVWFVFHGGDGAMLVANETKRIIQANWYANMGVTISTIGEYENSEDVLKPIA